MVPSLTCLSQILIFFHGDEPNDFMSLVNHRHSQTVNEQQSRGANSSQRNYVSTSFDTETRGEKFQDTVLCPPDKRPMPAWSGQDWSSEQWDLPVTLPNDEPNLLKASQQVGPDPVEGDFVGSCHGPATLEVQMDPHLNGGVYFVPWEQTAAADQNYSSSRPYVFKAGTPCFRSSAQCLKFEKQRMRVSMSEYPFQI